MWNLPEFGRLLDYDADVVLLAIGTNGGNKENTFQVDYTEMASKI